MQRTIKLFSTFEETLSLLRASNPDLPKFSVRSECMDTAVVFPEIDDDTFFDLIDDLFEYIYSDQDCTTEENLVRFLQYNGLTMATAESCTGGMIASSIVSISGASSVFYEGLVTYSNEAKMHRLDVSEATLEDNGAVSEEVAIEMALGLTADGRADLGISVTGIAGPDGGTDEKPVGLVFIGFSYRDYPPIAMKFHFDGDRTTVRTSAKNAALFYAWRYLEELL